METVHYLDDVLGAEHAYDVTQTRDGIRDGDLLVVGEIGVVGVMVRAWPVAVTAERGQFHELADGITWESYEGGKYAAAAAKAREIAEELEDTLRENAEKAAWGTGGP